MESTISTVSDDIAAERYEKIYNEASDLWRQDATLEQSIATFKTLRTKLGTVENRTLQSATEQENSGGPLKGTRIHRHLQNEVSERAKAWKLSRWSSAMATGSWRDIL